MIALGLSFGCGHHFASRFEAQPLLLQELRLRTLPKENDCPERKAKGYYASHRSPPFDLG